MPDSSRYDDRGIKEAMKASCVIVIGLSPAYLRSLRYREREGNGI